MLPLFIIGSINYFVDPDYTLRRDYIPQAALALTSGKILSGPVNANGRLLKKEWIENLKQKPEVLVLGSSRTFSIRQEQYPGKNFFNASVTNCTFQDMYAFINLVEKNWNSLPEEVIICCDQWLLGNSFKEERWLYNRNDFIAFLKKSSNISPHNFPRKWLLQKEWLKELFSVKYLIRSLAHLRNKEHFEIQDTVSSGKTMLLPDGSRLLPAQIIDATPKEITKRAENYAFTSHDEMFSQLEPLQCSLFKNLISYLVQKNCKITLFIPPYHPLAYKLLSQSEKHSGIFQIDGYLLKLTKQYHLTLMGATNPSVLNLTPSDFYDGVHLKPESLSLLINSNK